MLAKKNRRLQAGRDLFGEHAITTTDLFLWVAGSSPTHLSSQSRYLNYVKNYSVASKVAESMDAGVWWDKKMEFATIIQKNVIFTDAFVDLSLFLSNDFYGFE